MNKGMQVKNWRCYSARQHVDQISEIWKLKMQPAHGLPIPLPVVSIAHIGDGMKRGTST
jgi:hypothetical protein